MKKLILKIQIILMLTLSLSTTGYAISAADSHTNQLLPTPNPTNDQIDQYEELTAVQNLPKLSLEQAIALGLKTILGWAMLIALVALVISGIYYLKSEGDEESVSKAKRIVTYLVLGMAIMAAAYGVVTGLSQVDFFAGSTPAETTTTTE